MSVEVEEDYEPIMTILIKNGTYNDFMTLALIASGAVAADMPVRIFAMNDAVWSLKKENVGQDTIVVSHNNEYAHKLSSALNEGKVIPWWDLLTDLKDFGNVTLTVCALVADILELKKEDFHEMVDDIAGVANFAGDVEEAHNVVCL